MEPVVVGRNSVCDKVHTKMLPPSSVGSLPTSFGTASRIYQGSEVIDPPPPKKPPPYNQKLAKEIPSRSTTSLGIPIVRPSAPVGVVQAEGLPGGGGRNPCLRKLKSKLQGI